MRRLWFRRVVDVSGTLRFFKLGLPALVLSLACSPSTGPTSSTNARPRLLVSGSIREDTVWDRGRDYLVVGDVVVEEHSALTIQPMGSDGTEALSGPV